MRLKTLPVTPLRAAHRFSVVMTEAGALPRWQFDYDGKRAYDPRPDVLVLGAYVHPSTGNRLVGGININYMTSSEFDKLEELLPKIVRGRNLYERYNIGRSLNPLIFTTYYRTYNADNINMVGKGKVYPQYGEFVQQPDQRVEFEPAEAPPPQEHDDIEDLEQQAPAPRIRDVAVPTQTVPQVRVDVDQDAVMTKHAQEVTDEIENGEDIPEPETPPAVAEPAVPAQPEPAPEPEPPPQAPEQYEAELEAEPAEPMPDFDEPEADEEEPLRTRSEALPVEEPDEDIEPIDDTDTDRIEESYIKYYSPDKKRFIVEQWARSQ
jgi:hypothetical protein